MLSITNRCQFAQRGEKFMLIAACHLQLLKCSTFYYCMLLFSLLSPLSSPLSLLSLSLLSLLFLLFNLRNLQPLGETHPHVAEMKGWQSSFIEYSLVLRFTTYSCSTSSSVLIWSDLICCDLIWSALVRSLSLPLPLPLSLSISISNQSPARQLLSLYLFTAFTLDSCECVSASEVYQMDNWGRARVQVIAKRQIESNRIDLSDQSDQSKSSSEIVLNIQINTHLCIHKWSWMCDYYSHIQR